MSLTFSALAPPLRKRNYNFTFAPPTFGKPLQNHSAVQLRAQVHKQYQNVRPFDLKNGEEKYQNENENHKFTPIQRHKRVRSQLEDQVSRQNVLKQTNLNEKYHQLMDFTKMKVQSHQITPQTIILPVKQQNNIPLPHQNPRKSFLQQSKLHPCLTLRKQQDYQGTQNNFNRKQKVIMKTFSQIALERARQETKRRQKREQMRRKSDINGCIKPRGQMLSDAQVRKCPSWLSKKRELKVSDFEILKCLGQGRYGKVCLCFHKKTGWILALKSISKIVIHEQHIEELAFNQLKLAAFLKHPNILSFYGFFHDSKDVHLMMEYTTEGDLAGILSNPQVLHEEESLRILLNIYEAVAYLHSVGVLHRDIKPQNILASFGLYKLCDFGWAVCSQGQTRSTFCGTPLYVSPEILQGQSYDDKTDIWGLGVLTYRLIFGREPFQIFSPSDMGKIIYEPLSFPSASPWCPLLKKILSKNAFQRPSLNQILSHPLFQEPLASERELLVFPLRS